MARPEAKPKTKLAQRFREVRHALGFTERKQFAEHLGITAGSIGTYETGISEPTASALSKYQEICGVSLDWLVTGHGEMFSDRAKAKAAGLKPQAIPAGLMKKLGHLVYTTYHDANITLSPEDVAELAAELYGKLQELIENLNDMEEVEATLPLLKLHLKRKIEAEKAHKTPQGIWS
ncbi:helix-turn-helix domain-containing protein [Bartonella krasnovii]|uniref:Helix-turn-helix transcriptional regulator n=1 Tax=Bartonella krasnovii TaxID=2267275 RepID=A0A5B9CYR9_9HYPH|nr:helix-turn-helix transcriptional regulator [Bartonella krasnovii]QEE11483.1 helix-turn-helix transcriptional regulator [Bartonella krasnovii]UNF42301.1 helix-turn-helix domain-containing protein [Bartonella krasnovii]UNF53808.1 helix-turn-helix domain-containing protein [Bartonella krasnovii]UNF55509.1 helix-turn-helix domain-containing protein [Bartonella krasnovii]